jgi:hypothetical protein
MSAHDLITASLVYLSIGSAIWVVLDGLGIIENTFIERAAPSGRAMVLATLMMIVGWPWFVAAWINGMRRARR